MHYKYITSLMIFLNCYENYLEDFLSPLSNVYKFCFLFYNLRLLYARNLSRVPNADRFNVP